MKLPGSMPRNRQKIIEALSEVGLQLPTKDWLDENKGTSSYYYWCQEHENLIYCPSTKRCLEIGASKIRICLIGLRVSEAETEIEEPVETKAEINQNSLPETFFRRRNYSWELQEQPARKFLTRIGVLCPNSQSYEFYSIRKRICETVLDRFASFLEKKQRLREKRKHQNNLWKENQKIEGSSSSRELEIYRRQKDRLIKASQKLSLEMASIQQPTTDHWLKVVVFEEVLFFLGLTYFSKLEKNFFKKMNSYVDEFLIEDLSSKNSKNFNSLLDFNKGFLDNQKADLKDQFLSWIDNCGSESTNSLVIEKSVSKLKKFFYKLLEAFCEKLEAQGRKLLFDKFDNDKRRIVNQYHSILSRLDEAAYRCEAATDEAAKSNWQQSFVKLLRLCLNLQQMHDEHLSDELDRSWHEDTLLQLAMSRIQHSILDTEDTYPAVPTLIFKASKANPQNLLVKIEEEANIRASGSIGVMSRILNLPDFDKQVRAWNLDLSAIKGDEVLMDKAWEAISVVCRQYKMIPIANNGSRMLIQLKNQQGQLTDVAKLMDALFDNLSEVGAYGSSLLNAQPEGQELLTPHHEAINSFRGEDGRKSVCIVYDAKMIDWLPGVDGSGLNNFDFTGQDRSFALPEEGLSLQDYKELVAAFFKGLSAAARITLHKGKPYSVKDIKNVRWLSKKVLVEMFNKDLAEEITNLRPEDGHLPMSPALKAALDKDGHYVSITKHNLRKAREEQIARWESWFDERKDLPYVYAQEVGKLKGRGKKTIHLLMPELTKYGKDVKTILENCGGYFVLTAPIFGWPIICSPSKSSMALSYQAQAPLIYSPEESREFDLNAHRRTSEFFDGFRTSTYDDRLRRFLALSLGDNEADRFMKWSSAILRSPVASCWRWMTNHDVTTCSTKRVLMVNKTFRGLMIVSDNTCYEYDEQLKQPVEKLRQVACWRSPLIVSSAIQAPLAISGQLAARLLWAWKKKPNNRREADVKQLEILIERLCFKQEKSRKEIEALLPTILKDIIDLSMMVKLGDKLVIMDKQDLEDMQADDDGDTVSVEFNSKLVKRFSYTEHWWAEFCKVNNLRPTKIEMSKENQLEMSKGNGAYENKALSNEVLAFIKDFGINCPTVAKHYGLDGTKIPNPLGLNFALLLKIHKQTDFINKPVDFKNLCAKLGSTPTGPIGAGSDIAPDLLIRALAQTNESLVLNDYGCRLYQAYATTGSTVQVSIDWAKRVYRIMNTMLYDQKDANGDWIIDFEQEITPELAKEYLVSNTFRKVWLVRFKLCQRVDKKKVNTLGYMTVRFVLNGDLDSPFIQKQPDLFTMEGIKQLDTGKIYRISKDEIDKLKGGVENITSAANPSVFVQGNSISVVEVDLMDESNSCFSFSSMYSLGKFMLQPSLTGFLDSSRNFYNSTENAAAWKKKIDVIFAETQQTQRFPIRDAISKGYHASALNKHFMHMMDFISTHSNQGLYDLFNCNFMLHKAFNEYHQPDVQSNYLDSSWPLVNRQVASFFKDLKRGEESNLNRNKLVRITFKTFGFTGSQMNNILNRRVEFLQMSGAKVDFNIMHILKCLFRNDESWRSQTRPQSLAQIILSEYLKKSEPNPFEEVIEKLVDGEILSLKEDFSETNLSSFPAGVPACLSEYLDKRNVSFYDLYTSKKEETYTKRRWVTLNSPFEVLDRLFVRLKAQLFYENDELYSQLEAIWKKEMLKLEQGDCWVERSEELQRHLHSAVKLGVAVLDSQIRAWRSYASQDSSPVRTITFGKDQEGRVKRRIYPSFSKSSKEAFNNADIKTVGKHFKAVTPSSMFNQCRTLYQLWYDFKNNNRMATPQPCRLSLERAIYGLGAAKFIVSSYSYYRSVGWRSPQGIAMLQDHNSLEFFNDADNFQTLLFDKNDPLFQKDYATYGFDNAFFYSLEGRRGGKRLLNSYSDSKSHGYISNSKVVKGWVKQGYKEFQGLYGRYYFRKDDQVIENLFKYIKEVINDIEYLENIENPSDNPNYEPPTKPMLVSKVSTDSKKWEFNGRYYFSIPQLILELKESVGL